MYTTVHDWTKPAAIAIPKEGYFELERGRYGPVFPAPRPAMASRSSRRSRRVARTRSANTARPSKQRSPKRRSSSLHYACTTSAGCSSISAMA